MTKPNFKMKISTTFLSTALSLFVNCAFAAEASKPAPPPLSKQEQSVYTLYLKIQTGLAADSIKDLKTNATQIAGAIRTTAKGFSADVAKQAETLAAAADLKAARTALKELSSSMIKFLGDHKVAKGTYYEVFCPMVEASWLQSGKAIKNPYMGKAMLDCGVVKE